MGNLIDLTGQKFGRLTVISRAEDMKDKNHKVLWHCVCECGNKVSVRASSLTKGLTRSCGCLQKEKASELNSLLREYDENGMITKRICQRCKRMLPINNYYKNSTTADGHSGVCKYCQSFSLYGRYNMYKKGAKARNLIFDLTVDQFDEITRQECYYCGEYSGNYFDKSFSGIDRIDSSKGYESNNVVPCCDMCNRMKLDYNLDTWINKMKKILNHLEDLHE